MVQGGMNMNMSSANSASQLSPHDGGQGGGGGGGALPQSGTFGSKYGVALGQTASASCSVLNFRDPLR